jgi:hypothetical protein
MSRVLFALRVVGCFLAAGLVLIVVECLRPTALSLPMYEIMFLGARPMSPFIICGGHLWLLVAVAVFTQSRRAITRADWTVLGFIGLLVVVMDYAIVMFEPL